MGYLLYLQSFRETTGGIFDNLFLLLNDCSENVVTYLLMAMIYWCIDKRIGRIMAYNVSFSCWFGQWIKRIFRIERPWVLDYRLSPVKAAMDEAIGYALPSGGTLRAIANWGVLGKESSRKGVKIISYLVLFLISFSGLYLGIHTIRDELVAFAIGLFVMQLSEILEIYISISPRAVIYDIIICIIAVGTFILPMLKFGALSNAGISIGFIVGILLERRLLDFSIATSIKQSILRFLPGALFLVLAFRYFSFFIVYIVPVGYENFIINIVVGLFITFIYPFIFMNWENAKKRSVILTLSVWMLFTLCFVGLVSFSRYKHFKNDTCTIIADGGYSSIAPINTSAALKKAVDIGTDMVMLDIQLTADKVPVVYSEDCIWKISSRGGHIYDHTLSELKECDMSLSYTENQSSLSKGSQIKNYSGLQIMTLDEALDILDGENVSVLLNFKDFSDSKAVNKILVDESMSQVFSHFMLKSVAYTAEDYRYQKYIISKEKNADTVKVITSVDDIQKSEKNTSTYIISLKNFSEELLIKIHDVGGKCYVDEILSPSQMRYVASVGVDGIITGSVGQARIIMKNDYAYMGDNFLQSYTVPQLYDVTTQNHYKNYIFQGMTRVRDFLVISAYDSTRQKDSVIYVMNESGKLCRVINLGFKAHVGGIAYDEQRDLLWVTGSSGQVFALDFTRLSSDNKVKVCYKFDAGLYNAKSEHVASFLTIDNDVLYVGSYCEGTTGVLNAYDISEIVDKHNREPKLKYSIPERVQGMAIYRSSLNSDAEILFSQSAGYKNSNILISKFDDRTTDYTATEEKRVVPCMVEQPCIYDGSLYLLFESSARKYRAPYRVPNDQIWVLQYEH